MRFPTRFVLPGVVAAVVLASGTAACTYKNSDTASGGRAAPGARTDGGAELVDGSRTKVALVPGGAHPYKASKAAIEAMGGRGTLVHLTGNNVDANTQLRIKGVAQAVKESGGKATGSPPTPGCSSSTNRRWASTSAPSTPSTN
ncbi:hypothetical protein [Streptomyces phaeochromogenes]|uniref:hypothetical protein n=1 Tax=Streptomyces phaeochromogenes TaxID=1923 RepID=UPI00386CF475|nr:hypothetical protein OG277_06840 [Streptomyces phaeochromogenes]